jgi:hypothetical protein
MVHGNNLPLGIRAGEIYEQISVVFEPGDVLLFYSDGVTEARNATGELFGAVRLADCVRSNGAGDPEALVEAIRQAVCTFAASDELSDDRPCGDQSGRKAAALARQRSNPQRLQSYTGTRLRARCVARFPVCARRRPVAELELAVTRPPAIS